MPHENTCVCLSLSTAEVRLMTTGLDGIWSAHRLWETTGNLPYAHPKVIFKEPGFDRGVYSVAQMQVVESTRNKLQGLVSGGQLELEAFELAACLFAVRVTKTLLRHGHVKSWHPKHQEACRRLEKKLENLRKQAKRRFISARGQAAFGEASQQWKRFVRCVRVHFLHCACDRTRFVGLGRIRRLRRKEQIDALLPEILHLLPRWGRAVPPEPELRKLIGKALRSAQRYKRRRDRRGLVTGPNKIRRHVFGFIARRCAEGPDPHSILMSVKPSSD